MKTIQWYGPFLEGQKISIPRDMNYKITKIGIIYPESWPIEFLATDYKDNYGLYCDLKINNIAYHIDDLGILEFDNLAEIYLDIEFLRDLPFGTIIDVSYEQMEE